MPRCVRYIKPQPTRAAGHGIEEDQEGDDDPADAGVAQGGEAVAALIDPGLIRAVVADRDSCVAPDEQPQGVKILVGESFSRGQFEAVIP